MLRLCAHVNSQSVVRAQSVLEQNFSGELAVRRRFQQLLVDNRDVPPGEVLGSHRELARREEPPLALLRRQARRPESIPQIASRVRAGELLLVDVQYAF